MSYTSIWLQTELEVCKESVDIACLQHSDQWDAFIKKIGRVFRFRVLEVLANGGSALVEWRLETGRTHQVAIL